MPSRPGAPAQEFSMQRPLIVLILLLLALPCLAATEVYRWKDANGTVHFADAPPPRGIKYEIVDLGTGVAHEPPPPPAAPASVAAPAKDSAPKPMQDTPENRAKLCKSLSDNITLLSSDQPLTVGADNPTPMTAEQRATQLATAQAQQKQYCQ
jgi:hypothetical protein